MIKIRQSVFETNSSSTHAITMCSEDTYNRWMSGKIYWDNDNDELVEEEAMFKDIAETYGENTASELKELKEKDWEEFLDQLSDYSYYTRRSFINTHTYEHFHEKFVTPGGETVHSFGWYGSDY